jgi:hypothetical protein
MTKLDSTLRKEIVRNLHAAIDSEISDNDKVLIFWLIWSMANLILNEILFDSTLSWELANIGYIKNKHSISHFTSEMST